MNENNKLPEPASRHSSKIERTIELNFCKTLACENFGKSDPELYLLQRENPKRPAMVCRQCGAFPPLLNNHSVLAELQRIRHLHSDEIPSCRNPECENHEYSIYTHKHLYHAFGYSGERQRYRCKCCQTTFVDKWSSANKKLQLQMNLLGLLFTGYSVREICRKLSLNPKTFYDHINHIASRCRRKLATTDARWLNHAESYQFSSNYQALQPNSDNGVYWIATGESETGYILCQHFNYSEHDESEGDQQHDAYVDNAQILPHSFKPEAQNAVSDTPASLRERIDRKYQTILARENVEDPMGNLTKLNYPAKGALIRPPYTSYAHYLHVLEMCNDDKHVTIFMPQDPLLRSAALTVCLSRIQNESVDLVYVDQDNQWDNSKPHGRVDISYMSWWRDRWALTSQQSESGELHKGICHLAGPNSQPEQWINEATIDTIEFYQQRFRILFDSFINEPRRKLRPSGLLPLLDIFRAWHNLCYQHKDGKTAAQKLGVAESPLTIKELLC